MNISNINKPYLVNIRAVNENGDDIMKIKMDLTEFKICLLRYNIFISKKWSYIFINRPAEKTFIIENKKLFEIITFVRNLRISAKNFYQFIYYKISGYLNNEIEKEGRVIDKIYCKNEDGILIVNFKTERELLNKIYLETNKFNSFALLYSHETSIEFVEPKELLKFIENIKNIAKFCFYNNIIHLILCYENDTFQYLINLK